MPPLILLGLAGALLAAAHHAPTTPPAGPVFKAGGLQFVLPARWPVEPAATSVRAGQWRIPGPRGAVPAEDGELVAFYFGPGLGGTVPENFDGWRAAVTDPAGHPVPGEAQTHQAGGLTVSELVLAGTYHDPVPLAGVPPILRPGYGLVGAIVAGPQGSLYWRLTGPEPLVAATLPLLRRVIDSVKPLGDG
jgi:hypothetical protein